MRCTGNVTQKCSLVFYAIFKSICQSNDKYNLYNPYQFLTFNIISRRRFLLSLFLFSVIICSGQNITETQWFFGNSEANLQFDKNGILVYEEERMNPQFGTGGPAVISDQFNGNLLFYSDGVNIYDASHQLVSGNVPLTGDNTINQSAVACPIPGSINQYLIFTNSGSSGVDQIQYITVNKDLAGNGNGFEPLGEVVSAVNTTSLDSPSEGMIIVESQLPQTYWLISQDRNTFDFRVTIINPFGVGGTQIFNLDTAGVNPGAEAAQFAYNQFTNQLAVAPRTANRNVLILDFIDTTGVLQFNRLIRNTGFDDGQGESVYDVEWSFDGSKLYVSRFGDAAGTVGEVYHVNVADSLDPVTSILPNPVHRSLGLRLGIDGRIYHMYQENNGGPFLVGRISNADSLAGTVIYEPQYFSTDFNGRQFPAFAPKDFDSFNSVGFRYLDSCQNEATKFFPSVDPLPNNYFWNFPQEGLISNSVAPIVTFSQPGPQQVQLIVELNGTVQVHNEIINIVSTSLQVDLGADTVICVDETLDLDAGTGTFFQWNTGATSQTITIDTAGTYWVEVSDGFCSSFDAIQVDEYGVTTQISNQWYFGEMAGLDFNTQPPTALTDGQMLTPEGCATISDPDGKLLFYTNGSTVWNRDHQVMPILDTATHMGLAGNQIGGDSTVSQGVMIVPFMNDETMYYIFTAEEIYKETHYNMRYSIVDMKKDSADGAVILRNMPLFDNSVEKITASGFTTSAWIAMHEFGNNNFRANLIDQFGISATVHTPSGEVIVGQNPVEGSGYMKFNPGITQFINLTPGVNNIEIFEFDNRTGNFSNPLLIQSGENGIYGLEYSGDGTKFYVTTGSKLIQFDLDSINSADPEQDILDSKFDNYTTGSGYGALQTGPTGVIYMAVDGSNTLFTIDTPNGDDGTAGFNTSGQDLAGRTSRLGLPNFTQNSSTPPQSPGVTLLNPCFGQPTEFFATGTSQIDEFFWTFDTAATNPTEFGANVQTLYSTPGFHTYQLDISNRCFPPDSSITFIDSLEVISIPEQPQIPSEANLCSGPLTFEAWFEDRPDLMYSWRSNGIVIDTSRVITINQPEIYEVNIINTGGCTSDTIQIDVADNRPFLDLGNDRNHCQNELGLEIDANTSGVTFDWFLDGSSTGNQDTSRYQSIDTGTPGTYEYSLTIEEPFFGCTQSDTVQVVILESPAITSFPTAPSNCGANDGTIQFIVDNSGSFVYDISGPSLFDRGTLDGPGGTSPFYSPLSAGNYQLYVENIVSGCTTLDPITIEDDVPFEVSATNLPECLIDVNLSIAVTGLTLPDIVNVYITDLIGDTLVTENNITVPVTRFPRLDSGFYFVNVEDVSNNCTVADTVLIDPYLPGVTDCIPEIIAPNAFSPNGNGFNEEFFIFPNAFVDRFEIFIYSRWGELVFYSDEQTFRWDGVFNGKDLPPGTFAYIMKFTSREEPELGILVQHGAVTIVK